MQSIPQDLLKDAAVQWQLTSVRFQEWIENDVLRFRWWLLLSVFILSVLIWWRLADQSRLHEIILFAGITCIIILILDELGEEMTLWDYPVEIFPLFPPISSVDLASLPMVYSLIYQYCQTWKSFTIASFLFSALSCFVLEPLFVLVGIYQMITWRSYYGLPLYFAIALFAKAMIVWIRNVESKHRTK